MGDVMVDDITLKLHLLLWRFVGSSGSMDGKIG